MPAPASLLDRGEPALCLAGHLPRPGPEGSLGWQEEQGGGWRSRREKEGQKHMGQIEDKLEDGKLKFSWMDS